MRAVTIAAGLAGVLMASGALAGGDKTHVSGNSYTVTTGDSGEDGVRVVLSGEGGGNVLVLSGKGADGPRTLRMQSNDGRVVFETEPDPSHPWLGVLLTVGDEGVAVDSVMDGSPADEAGLRVGDLIVAADGRDLTGPENRGGLLEGKKPGDRVRFTVQRDGKVQQLRAKLGSHPGRVEFEIDEAMGPFGMAGNMLGGLESLKSLEALKGLESLKSLKGLSVLPLFDCGDDDQPCSPSFLSLTSRSKPRLGVVLETLSPQLAGFFEVAAGEGMLVKEVLEGSVAQRAGLSAGDVLMQIDDTRIASLTDVRDALKGVEKGESVRIEVSRRGVRETYRADLDSDPNPSGDFLLNFGSGDGSATPGQQGALQWLDQSREALDLKETAQFQQAVELARQGRLRADADLAKAANAEEVERRRALEAALAAARETGKPGEAERTF